MSGDLFVAARNQETLGEFARRLGDIFQSGELDHRESSNYVENEYYLATVLSLKIVFAWADEEDLDDYKFWIHFRVTGAWIQDESFIDGLADLLARRLTIAGESVVRVLNAERRDRTKMFYTLNADAPHFSREQVVVREE